MKIRLLSHGYKYLASILLITGLILAYLVLKMNFKPDYLDWPVFAIYSSYTNTTVFGMTQTNIADELAMMFVLISLVLFCLSRKKHEKDFYMNLRVKAIFYAMIIYAIALSIAILTIFGTGFIAMLFFGLYAVFVIYLVVFNFLILITRV